MLKGSNLSPALDSAKAAHHYFEQHLPSLIGRLLLPDYRALTCRFGVVLDSTEYRMALVQGRLTAARDSAAPQVIYTLDARTLIDVITARCTPQDAFYDMRVDISGDIELGLELGAVFEEFFRFHPYALPGL